MDKFAEALVIIISDTPGAEVTIVDWVLTKDINAVEYLRAKYAGLASTGRCVQEHLVNVDPGCTFEEIALELHRSFVLPIV